MIEQRKYRDYKELLFEQLKNAETAAAYLNESLKERDERSFLLALQDVFESKYGNIEDLKSSAKFDSVNIRRIFARKKDVLWKDVIEIVNLLDVQFTLVRKT